MSFRTKSRNTLSSGTDKAAQPKGEFWTIQAMRFVAAFAVVLIHSTFYTQDRLAPGFPLYVQGYQGVRLFFVISGFVMIVSSQRLMAYPDGWRVFAFKRILRIVPLYWFILGIKLALVLVTTGFARHTSLDGLFLLKSFFFVPAMNEEGEIKPFHGVGWTLNFEMFFYLLYTIAMLLRIPPVRSVAPVLVLMAILSFCRTQTWPVAAQFLCDPIVLDFLAGMIVARWYQRGLVLPHGAAMLLAVVGVCGLFVPLAWPPMLPFIHSVIITGLCFAAITGAVALEPKLGPRIPGSILFVGAASYSLYLIHPLIAPIGPVLLAKIGLPIPILAVVISLIASLVAGSLSYQFVEKPIVRFVARHLKGLTSVRSMPSHLSPIGATGG